MTETAEQATRPPRQEQERASGEVTEVAPGILRMQLPIDLPGLGHVNTYALEDSRGVALIDPGLPTEDSWQALCSRLAQAGMAVDDVHTVVITHSHADHFGGAARLAEETGADVVTSRHFTTILEPDGADVELDLAEAHDAAWVEARIDELPWSQGATTPWGGRLPGPSDEDIQRMREHPLEARRWLEVPRTTVHLDDDDTISLGRRRWRALFTPGHTNDHLCFYDPETGVLISGDHVLPTITPHISGLVAHDALATYVRSLERVAGIPEISVVLPAHGHPFHDLPGRVEAIEVHHEERLERLRAISEELGWAGVGEISRHLFSERSWGPMAESEAYAHLEHLRTSGRAERRSEGSDLLYRVT